MPKTYEPIATYTVPSAQSSYTFNSIPITYTDLVIVAVPATTSGNDNLGMRVGNGSVDTGTNYSVTVITGNGSAAASDRNTNQTSFLCDYYGSTGATLGNNIKTIQIMNYSNTTTNKSILVRANRPDSGTDAIVGLWRSTVAINTITLFGRGGSSFATGTTFTLYGIKAA